MSLINVTNVVMSDAASPFTDPIVVDIAFDALQELKEPLIWRVIYVGCSYDEGSDQLLEDIEMPINQTGPMKFRIETGAPDVSKIRHEDLIGVTAILITCSYNNNEFFRVGYYVKVLYANDDMNETPPSPPQLDQLGRVVLVSEPRVTNFPIEWDDKFGTNTLGIVPPEQIENFNPTEGFGYNKEMCDQDRKEMLSQQNLQNAAEVLKSPFSNITNAQ